MFRALHAEHPEHRCASTARTYAAALRIGNGVLLRFLSGVNTKEILVAPCGVSTRICGFNLVPEVRTSLFEVLSAEGKPFFRNGAPSVYVNANGL